MATLQLSTTKKQRRLGRHLHTALKKYVFAFSEGNLSMKQLLGGKGACLADMSQLGIPVPPGFTISTEVCDFFLKEKKYPSDFSEELKSHLKLLETKTGKNFGSPDNPLLVSVRSGAAVSMPGMMDTILNLGLNESSIQGLIKRTGNERFCYDSYRRFIQMFGDVVLGIAHGEFEQILSAIKKEKRIDSDIMLDVDDLKKIVANYKNLVLKTTGLGFPEDPHDQLIQAIRAVFGSWNTERAIIYRKINKITGLLGTAVTIQSMVFGNMGSDSGTGVAFTRNPSTGKKEFYGEFLINAQGEDVVAGIRTPQKIIELKQIMPSVYRKLLSIQKLLERHYKNMQDIEFTIEKGSIYILQTRNGKRTAQASLKIATDMVYEGLISQKDAVMQVNASQLSQVLHPMVSSRFKGAALCKGLAASPGAAVGKVVFTSEDACKLSENSEKVILVRRETSPEDIAGMSAAQGILTSTGGMTSHAAVVCRGMGKCCIAGCADIHVDGKNKLIICRGIEIKEGDVITLNGATGEIFLGEVPLEEPEISKEFKTFMKWVDGFRRLHVRTNADTPNDAIVAKQFGAEGIGLCRTEHMFFEENRIPKIREMILAQDVEGRKKALEKLLPLQREDFVGIFKAMNGYPVTIRLLDPPLHEFIPTTQAQIEQVAQYTEISESQLKRISEQLHEINPMLGHRGCRLGITYPEIYEMQVIAIVQAAVDVTRKGIKAFPEIEIPFVGISSELKTIVELVKGIINRQKTISSIDIKIGTMIELPRACLIADEIAQYADFLSFGTNDLTQMTFGISRDDAGKFLPFYMDNGLLEFDPTETIDQKGVGELMKICVRLARSCKPNLEIGICGEHGGEAKSIEFCHKIGLNYVSCSPYRIPVAKLAAAQAYIKEINHDT